MYCINCKNVKKKTIPVTGLGGLLWDVEYPTFYRQIIHGRRLCFRPYTPATLYSHEDLQVLISVRDRVNTRAMVRLEALGKLKKKINELIGTGIGDLPACSIASQPPIALSYKNIIISIFRTVFIQFCFVCSLHIPALFYMHISITTYSQKRTIYPVVKCKMYNLKQNVFMLEVLLLTLKI
jgi:hypothetical protein